MSCKFGLHLLPKATITSVAVEIKHGRNSVVYSLLLLVVILSEGTSLTSNDEVQMVVLWCT